MDIVLVETEMGVVLIRTETALILVETKIYIIQIKTEIDIVLVKTGINIQFVKINIKTVQLNIKVLLAIVRLSPFTGYINGKESSYINLKRVIKLLKYLFKLRIKFINREAPLRESKKVYINLDIQLKSNINSGTIERNSPLKGCVAVITIPRELIDLKVRSVMVFIREIQRLALV